jgi:two-component system, OmpR family, phosphate regulon sensor histidine kinase PhoR
MNLLSVLLLLGLITSWFACWWLWQQGHTRQYEYERALKLERQNTQTNSARLQSFLSAIHASPNGVVVMDSQQRIEWCNQTAAQLLGLDAVRDVGQHLVHLVRNPQVVEYLAAGNWSEEVQFERMALQLHPYNDQALLLVRDITQTQRADQMRRDFVANVSHEIRTPLTVLLGFIETLQSLALGRDEQHHYLQLMQVQSQRMQALVDDLLTLSKLDEQVKPKLEHVDVAALLAQCEQEARSLAQSLTRELSIIFERDDTTALIGSTSELHSAFSNLIINAVRYTPHGGNIHVTWAGKVLTVRDTGQGIAPEHLPRITERFYRVDQSRARTSADKSGTGLGLAIVKHVAQRHGAKLEIESVLGVGSTFRLVFA